MLQFKYIKIFINHHLKWAFLCASIILSPLCLYGQAYVSTYRVAEDTIQVTLNFPDPVFSEFPINGKMHSALPLIFENLLFLSLNGSIDVSVMEKRADGKPSPFPVIFMEDIPIGWEAESGYPDRSIRPPAEVWEKQFICTIDDKAVNRVRIYPYHGDESSVNRIREITLRVVGKGIMPINEDSRALHSIADQPRNLLKSQKSAGLSQPDAPIFKQPYPRLKILVKKEGIYILPRPVIEAAGWDVSSIDPVFLRMVGSSGEIPIRIRGEGDGSFDFSDVIEFYGEPLWDVIDSTEYRLDVFANQNVYWLELGENRGLRYAQEEGGVGGNRGQSIVTPRSYLFTQHEEGDNHFNRLPHAIDVNDGDHWFMSGPIYGGRKGDFDFHLASPDKYSTQLGKIRMKLRGQSYTSERHDFEVYLNDRRIITGSWQGNRPLLLESIGFSPMHLDEDGNRLTIVNRSASEESVQLFPDWFEITYPRLYESREDFIRFKAPKFSTGKICRFEIDGFSNGAIEVYKKDVSHIFGSETKAITDSLGITTHRLIFQDLIVNPETEYIAFTKLKKSIPDSIALIEDPQLRSDRQGGDYIIIVPHDSLGAEPLKDLIELRESLGHWVRVVNLEDIYNEFNLGIRSPEAIREFLKYAYHYWSPAPQYVLLVGDGLIDNRRSGKEGLLIPVPLFQTTKYGGSPSDHWYTLLEGDDHIPECAIGRLPIRTRRELEMVIAKIVNYERSPKSHWRNRYLLIGAGGQGGPFFNQSEVLIRDVFSPNLHPERLYLSGDLSDPHTGGTEDLLQHFRDGVGFVNFRGHGGGAVWSDAGLLDLDDIRSIENRNKLPIITSMTCFTSDFSGSPLGEALVCQEEMGAIAFWGATGLGWLWNDYYLLRELIRAHHAEPNLTLGEAIRRGKSSYLLIYGGNLGISEVHQYTLLGDPALRFPFPVNQASLKLKDSALSVQDSIRIEGMTDSDDFHVILEITGSDRAVLNATNLSYQQNSWEATLPLPPNFTDSEGGIRTYLWDSEKDDHAHGFVPFSVGRSHFDSMQSLPPNPSRHDTIHFSIMVEDPNGLLEVVCRILLPDTLKIGCSEESGRYITNQSVGPFSPGKAVTYSFIAENGAGDRFESEAVTVVIPTLPDLAVTSISLGGTDQVILMANIKNFGGENVENVSIRLECFDTDFTKEEGVDVSAYGDTVVPFPFSPPVLGSLDFFVSIDPDSGIVESRKDNNHGQSLINMDRFNVTPERGSYLGTISSDTVGLPHRLLCFIPPGAVKQRTTLFFEDPNMFSDLPKGMIYPQHETLFRLFMPGLTDAQILEKDAVLQFYPNSGDSDQLDKPYFWDASIQRWILCQHVVSDSSIFVQTESLGYFRLMNTEDDQPPRIEIQVEDQPFTDGSYVSAKSSMTAVIQDESGVDIRPMNFKIFIDDDLLPHSILSLPDSTDDPRNIIVTFQPELEAGEHTLSIEASDVHGNPGNTGIIHFRRSDRLEIQFLGNYPNPFIRETTFIYTLTDVARKVILKIYTVSGMLIRTIDSADMAGADYHEVVWDGRDEWGEAVANGVYFFRIRTEGWEKTQEITGKIAKIR